MSCSQKSNADGYLGEMFNQIQPKARYIAEMHVQEYMDQLYMEIAAGDTQIPKKQIPYKSKTDRHGFEDQLRQKMIASAAQEKMQLQRKLQYLSHSIDSLKRHADHSPAPNSRTSNSIHISTPKQKQQWRKDIEERSKLIEKKKNHVQAQKQKKENQLKEIEERIKREEEEKRKKQLEDRQKQIEERSKRREEEVKTSYDRYKEIKSRKKLADKLQQGYKEKETSFLEERKKKLAEIRSLHRPIGEMDLKEHEERFLEMKKQKQQMREREKRMNESRSNSYAPVYKSVFYQRELETSRVQNQNSLQMKKERMKQFSQRVKEQFVPEVDDKKRQQLEELREKERQRLEEKIERDKQLLELPKKKGSEYLDLVKNLPKKSKDQISKIEQQASKTDRPEYKNYLTHSRQEYKGKPWAKILSSQDDKTDKALQLQLESQKRETSLKRKEQQIRLMKQGNSGDIDQEYFDMIKAKLDLLKTET